MNEPLPTVEIDAPGSAHGSDPRYHHIVDREFVCTAPEDALCRAFPTCDQCEQWCCCASPGENHDEDDHCCMTTVKSGQPCWIGGWVYALGVEDSHCEEDDNRTLRDGAVACDWDEGICWMYVTSPGSGDPS